MTDRDDLRTIEVGARMLRLNLHPHQLALGDLLDSGVETTAVCWPRRAGKTTATWAWLLGRCETVPESSWVTTAQTGIKARDRFMSVARQLDRFYPEDKGGPHIFRGAGHEALEFSNGSRLVVVAPKGEAFRGEGASVYVDEPQEFDAVKGDDLRQAVYPLLDTLDDGQVILSGTAGRVRAGWFWGALEAGRQGSPGYALSEFAAPDSVDPEDEGVWQQFHPGIGTLTTLEKMRARRAGLSLPMWCQEYLGIWPPDNSTSAIDMVAWADSAVPQVELPDRFGIAYDVAPDSSSAAVCAGWRDEDGVGYVAILEHRQGVSWMPRMVAAVAKKYRLPVRYDGIGANHGPSTEISRLRGVQLVSCTAKDAQAATQSFVSNLTDGTLRHFDQASLTAAAEGAAWRQSEGGRYFARKASACDIAPLVACALALFQFDQMPERRPITIRSSAA